MVYIKGIGLLLTTSTFIPDRVESREAVCPSYDTSALRVMEKELIQDCDESGKPFSALGNIDAFPVTFSNNKAEMHFILGLKALHNFEYDFCKFEFEQAIAIEKEFSMAYWGRALCETQLLWNSENPKLSLSYIEKGKTCGGYDRMSKREKDYFDSVQRLNTIPSNKSQSESMEMRFFQYYKDLKSIYENEAYKKELGKEDLTAGSFVVLMSQAVASVGHCKLNISSDDCQNLLQESRSLSMAIFSKAPWFSGNLHYGLHAHDVTNKSIADEGLILAAAYPKYVKETVHSMHMAAHIAFREGDFNKSLHADLSALEAGKRFARSDMLVQDGGPINTTGFGYDAGNRYHSIEYASYSFLNLCEFRKSRKLISEMNHIVTQAMENLEVKRTSKQEDFEAELGKVGFEATTYNQWQYRMVARQIQFSLLLDILGKIDQSSAADWRGSLLNPLPIPLNWNKHSASIYSHGTYSPQSEVGYWNGISLSYLYDLVLNNEEYQEPEIRSGRVCQSEGCLSEIVSKGLLTIDQATKSYVGSLNYESKQSEMSAYQVKTYIALAQKDIRKAWEYSEKTMNLELESRDLFLPTSTSLMFIPGDAFHGVTAVLLYSFCAKNQSFCTKEKISSTKLLINAKTSFESCLSFEGRPNYLPCELGLLKIKELSNNNISSDHVINFKGQGNCL